MRFLRDLQDGFVLIMSLLILPVFLGFGLILIDVGRGNNAHGDLQAIVDAMALTGARELDSSTGARAAAQSAMTELTNPVGMLRVSGTTTQSVTYTVGDSRFEIVFLTTIPALDTTPIDASWKSTYAASSDADANYVYVRAFSVTEFSLELMFEELFEQFGVPGNQPIGAIAVATANSVICDIPPIFVCNPFEFTAAGAYDPNRLQTEFAAGNLHGRLIRLHSESTATAFPGNFGFLQVDGTPSNSDIRDFFAGATSPFCAPEGGTVDTAPGDRPSLGAGINVRFDVMPGPNYGNTGLSYFPAIADNVRKGFIPSSAPSKADNYDDCVPNGAATSSWSDDHVMDLDIGWPTDAMGNPQTYTYTGDNGTPDGSYGFPDNNVMVHPSTAAGSTGTPGAYVGTDSNWPLQTYLDKNFGVGTYTVGTGANLGSICQGASCDNISSFSGRIPSRNDVYNWEIDNGLTSLRTPTNLEFGLPNCSTEDFNRVLPSITTVEPTTDPRVLVTAIIDCVQAGENGAGGNSALDVNTYASFFLTRPFRKWFNGPGAKETLDIEIVDVLGVGGSGSLDDLVRTESFLVR